MTTTISVLWPAVQLSETGWRERVESLAVKAEALIGRKCTLQQTAELGLELVGLIWPAIGPETVAASCRASLAVGPPGLLMAASGGDQWSEIHQRLDDIYAAAQADPSVALVELPSVMLQRVVSENHGGRPKRARADHPVELPDQAPEDHPGDAELITQVVAAEHPSELPEPLDQVAADHPIELEPITQAVEAVQQLDAWGFLVEPEPSPAPLPPAPPDWFTATESAELLGISRSTIVRWCKQGRLGEPGENWLPSGRTFKVDPQILDALLGAQEPAAPTPH